MIEKRGDPDTRTRVIAVSCSYCNEPLEGKRLPEHIRNHCPVIAEDRDD